MLIPQGILVWPFAHVLIHGVENGHWPSGMGAFDTLEVLVRHVAENIFEDFVGKY